MKVITHGNIIHFDCKVCGCQFDAGILECIDDNPYTCLCPDCGTATKGTRLDRETIEEGDDR